MVGQDASNTIGLNPFNLSHRVDTRRPRGYVLLGGQLLGTLALASVALFGLRSAGRVSSNEQARVEGALARAKLALLGYAASYADQHSDGVASGISSGIGPGFLPCPDVDRDGSPDTACAKNASGELPWRRLGVPRQSIHYMLSDRFRNNPHKHVPLNSETLGQLHVGTRGQVVAVLAGRLLGSEAAEFDASSYLHPSSEEAGAGPLTPSQHSRGQTVVALTGPELARVVELRAITATKIALARFRNASWNPARVYPWLRRVDSTKLHWADVGLNRGTLPLHSQGLFGTGFYLVWYQPSAGVEARRALATLRVDVTDADGRCVWEGVRVFRCQGTGRAVLSSEGTVPAVVSAEVSVSLNVSEVIVGPPGPTRVRTRGFELHGVVPAAGHVWVNVRPVHRNGSGWTYWASSGHRIHVELGGIRYALAPGEEIPYWYLEHGWSELIHVGVSQGFGPSGGGECGERSPCLRVRSRGVQRAVAGVVVATGPPLQHQRRGQYASLGDYLEGRNAESNGLEFEVRPTTASFNDRVVAIPLTGPRR